MSLNIDFCSDLHMEINGSVERQIKIPDGNENDVMILAGDITNYKLFGLEKTDPSARGMKKRMEYFLKEKLGRYETILYVPGNHEYYGHYWREADSKFQDDIAKIDDRVLVLQNGVLETGEVHIFCSTFWTDFNKGDPLAVLAAENGMNDYRAICETENSNKKIRGYMTDQAHAKSRKTLSQYLQYNTGDQNKKFIVATHHGPSLQSFDSKRYGVNDTLKFGYLSDLDDYIRYSRIDYWIHGHTHHNVDYQIGNCQVKSAMHGYNGSDRLFSDPFEIGRITI